MLKGQRKHRFPRQQDGLHFNRRCDLHPVGNQVDGALLVSVVTPLADDYELYDKAKCLLESGTEGGYVLIRLGNDESLGRELRTYLQTEKYVRHKNDGTLPESTEAYPAGLRRGQPGAPGAAVTLLGEMLAAADYFVAGQPLKLKATSPLAALDEALEYLVKNTFTQDGLPEAAEPGAGKEIQAVLAATTSASRHCSRPEEGNKQAIEDLRNYVGLWRRRTSRSSCTT